MSLKKIERQFDDLLKDACSGIDYDLALDNVHHRLSVMENKAADAGNERVRDKLRQIREEIVTEGVRWDPCSPCHLADFRTAGQGLAKAFFEQGGREANKKLIQEKHPSLECSNMCSGKRPMCTYGDTIYVQFFPSFPFSTYFSYPFLFLHEYCHIYTEETDCKPLDGWMIYAAELFCKNNWSELASCYSLSAVQKRTFSTFSRRKVRGLAKTGYDLAEDVNLWVGDTDFLKITWDLASYPPALADELSFHTEFLLLMEDYTSLDKGNVLAVEAQKAETAQQLLGVLSAPKA